jgi:hypothetical protein
MPPPRARFISVRELGRHAAIVRTLDRLTQFDMATIAGERPPHSVAYRPSRSATCLGCFGISRNVTPTNSGDSLPRHGARTPCRHCVDRLIRGPSVAEPRRAAPPDGSTLSTADWGLPQPYARPVEGSRLSEWRVSTTIRTFNAILNGARDGQGTSTFAASLTLYAAGRTSTLLVATDTAAAVALLGLPETNGDETLVAERLTLGAEPSGDPAVRLIDAGIGSAPVGVECDLRLVVLRGPCYVALRSLVNGGGAPAGLILLREPGRSLSERDVRDVTGVPVVATIPVSGAVARTIDAGLFIARLDRLRDLAQLRRYATDLLDLRTALSEPQNDSTSRISTAVIDGSKRPCDRLSKVGTDLPVPLCGTGRSRKACRVSPLSRAFPAHEDNICRRRNAEYRDAGWRRGRLLHRRGRVIQGGLLRRTRRSRRALGGVAIAHELALGVEVDPERFPLAGRFLVGGSGGESGRRGAHMAVPPKRNHRGGRAGLGTRSARPPRSLGFQSWSEAAGSTRVACPTDFDGCAMGARMHFDAGRDVSGDDMGSVTVARVDVSVLTRPFAAARTSPRPPPKSSPRTPPVQVTARARRGLR